MTMPIRAWLTAMALIASGCEGLLASNDRLDADAESPDANPVANAMDAATAANEMGTASANTQSEADSSREESGPAINGGDTRVVDAGAETIHMDASTVDDESGEEAAADVAESETAAKPPILDAGPDVEYRPHTIDSGNAVEVFLSKCRAGDAGM